MLLASQFSGRPLDPGVDEVLDAHPDGDVGNLRLVEWTHADELQEKLIAEIVETLGLTGPTDEIGFEGIARWVAL